MTSIKDIASFPGDYKKIEKNNESKRVDSKRESKKADSIDKISTGKDRAEISLIGREMQNLKTEALKYLKLIQEAETSNESEIEEIRQKLLADYFSNPEVVDKIIDELASLPNFSK